MTKPTALSILVFTIVLLAFIGAVIDSDFMLGAAVGICFGYAYKDASISGSTRERSEAPPTSTENPGEIE